MSIDNYRQISSNINLSTTFLMIDFDRHVTSCLERRDENVSLGKNLLQCMEELSVQLLVLKVFSLSSIHYTVNCSFSYDPGLLLNYPINELLITGHKGSTRETVSFVSPRPSMFLEPKPSQTLWLRGNRTYCFPWGQSLSVLL